MTEKQFYLLNYNNYPIYDSLNDKEYNAQFKKQRENLCDLLNEQHETIEELEKDNKEYIRGLDLSKATSQAWASDVRELREQNFQLEKENEQLKQELKRCKDWINSDKNDYELTLSFIKNKGYSLKDVLEYEKELKSG